MPIGQVVPGLRPRHRVHADLDWRAWLLPPTDGQREKYEKLSQAGLWVLRDGEMCDADGLARYDAKYKTPP